MPPDVEYRAAQSVDTDAALGTFAGHASVFWAVDDHVSAFAPRAFRRSLAEKADRIPVLYFHEPSAVVGPTLALREDRVGLWHESKAIEDGGVGAYVLAHLRGGSPMGMSFGFRTEADRAGLDDDPFDLTSGPSGVRAADVRVITAVDLLEISVLPWTFASQPKAGIDRVRGRREAGAAAAERVLLADLTAALDAGTLDPETREAVALLVAAWDYQGTTPAPPDPAPPPVSLDRARRDRELALALRRAQFAVLGGVAP